MYLLATICLLGLSSAQKVTELTSCLTKDNNLRMDCKYEPDTSATAKPSSCKYTLDGKVVGSSDVAVSPDAAFKNRTSVVLMDGNVCRLSLNRTGLLDHGSPKNYTCLIKQQAEATRMATVNKNPAKCTSLGVLLQGSGGLLAGLTMLPLLLLLETPWP